MKAKMKFALIGGDMRQAKLAELLADDGHIVSAFAMDKVQSLWGVKRSDTLFDAVSEADCVILPLPLIGREGCLNTPLSEKIHSIEDTLRCLSPKQLICAGRIDSRSAEMAGDFGLEILDYFKREELAVLNAIATAEGAIQLAMTETATTIHRSKILVIGFGRIGKMLAHRLKGLGAYVTVSARSYADFAWIRAYGYESAETLSLEGTLGRYDIVFNTVPARVLGEERLRELSKDCLCMDLASKPGGMDFAAASKLGIKAIWALSLPGEVAPITSGSIIKEAIYNIISEQEALK
ncbi:MAG: dipicolinate synthase subunit DpsA [Clostridiales bacterium]|nr:dipicolinate synthase subunit DpsA [Clostridiales bacterium]